MITETNAPIFVAWCEVVLAAAAVLALCFAFAQIRQDRSSGKEATAKAIWREFEKLCFDHPRFANPKLAGVVLDVDNMQFDGKHVDFERYEWFVAIMLFACDEIIEALGTDNTWRDYLRDHLRSHDRYLNSSRFKMRRFLDQVSRALQKMIGELA